MLGLTVGLSAASRSLQDINQSTQTDSGTRALAGAEAGLQYGLTKFDPSLPATSYPFCISSPAPTPVPVPMTTPFPGFNTGSIGYTICREPNKAYAETIGLAKDDVLQVEPSPSIDHAVVMWKGFNSAVEVSVLYYSVAGGYEVQRFAFNSNSTSNAGNNFVRADPGAPCVIAANRSGQFCGDDSYMAGSSCTANTEISLISGTKTAKLIRVRRLYNSGDTAVCGQKIVPLGTLAYASMDIPSLSVIGTATTTGGTTRRVQASITPGVLSGMFDYAIYTEGALTK